MTTVDTPIAVTAPAMSAETKDDSRRLWFKEIVTALLALVVLGALLFAYQRLSQLPDLTRYGAGQDAAREANASNVDKTATALFGIFAAFVGYYAGRVPAEKAAADSRAAADQAQQHASAAQTQNVTAQAELNERTRRLEQELAWSDRAVELLERSVPLLDPERGRDLVTSDVTDTIPPRLLATEVARHVRRRIS